jgi:hypothetical protein
VMQVASASYICETIAPTFALLPVFPGCHYSLRLPAIPTASSHQVARQHPLSILRVYRNSILQSTAKKRAPEIVAPSSSHTGASPLRRNLARGERERATRHLHHHNSMATHVLPPLGNMRVFRAKWKRYHFSIHCSCYKLTVDIH